MNLVFNTQEEIKTRVYSYYPLAVLEIKDIQCVLDVLIPYFYQCDLGLQEVLKNATFMTMSEERTQEWEKLLGITPIANSTLQDRRETIIARIRGIGKLNTESINAIVKTFTGGYAESYFKNSTLYVEITPPPNDKRFIFENVEQELKRRVPAHINFKVSRNYYTWGEVDVNNENWQAVEDGFESWFDLYLYSPFPEVKN